MEAKHPPYRIPHRRFDIGDFALPGVLRAARIPVGDDTENRPVFRVGDHECIGEFSSGCPKRESQLFLYEPILAGQRGSCVEELPLKKPELFDMHDT